MMNFIDHVKTKTRENLPLINFEILIGSQCFFEIGELLLYNEAFRFLPAHTKT